MVQTNIKLTSNSIALESIATKPNKNGPFCAVVCRKLSKIAVCADIKGGMLRDTENYEGIGWEAWTRTRKPCSRGMCDTNFTTSQLN